MGAPKWPSARASSTDGAPDQASCTSGSTSLTWDGLHIARPVIASLSVDGETVADPTAPDDGGLGASVCPNTDLGRRTGLFVYYHHGSTNGFELTGAVTPVTHTPITASSKITITLTNMGDLAKFYSFALVHGAVSSWQTANLGSAAASLTVTLSPVRTPFGTGSDFGFCTATPPNCSANKSDADVLTASLDMTFDQTAGGTQFAGAYFALVGAMSGWVQPAQNTDGSTSLVATLGAPHFLADGSTRNTGSMKAFLPNAVVESLLKLTPGSVNTSSLNVTRTEGDSASTAVTFSVAAVSGGILVSVNDITFSSPVYVIKKAGAVTPPLVSKISVSGLSGSEATINWTTNELADSSVNYGKTNKYGQTATDAKQTKTHSLKLTGLDPSTKYHYMISSKNSAGATGKSPDEVFTTKSGVVKTALTLTATSYKLFNGKTATLATDGSTVITPSQPITLTGTTAASAALVLTIKSDPITKELTAGSDGQWSFVVDPKVLALAPGAHTVSAVATDSKGVASDTVVVAAFTLKPLPATPAISTAKTSPIVYASIGLIVALLAAAVIFIIWRARKAGTPWYRLNRSVPKI